MMSPEDRLARLLAALDRLPQGARRALAVLLPVALLGALVASLLLAPHTRPRQNEPAAERTRAAAERARPATRSPAPARPDPTPPVGAHAGGDVGAGSVAAAIDPGRAFIESYVAFSYGHVRRRAIRAADPALVATFADQRVPSAQGTHHPRVVALRVTAFSAGVARATAVVADGHLRYPLVFFLERRPGGWLVTRMAD
jgi:hypothetical protein